MFETLSPVSPDKGSYRVEEWGNLTMLASHLWAFIQTRVGFSLAFQPRSENCSVRMKLMEASQVGSSGGVGSLNSV